MPIFLLMWRQSPALCIACLCSEMINAGMNLGLILMMSRAMSNPSAALEQWGSFAILVVLSMLTRTLACAGAAHGSASAAASSEAGRRAVRMTDT